jgi:hypothetical protein
MALAAGIFNAVADAIWTFRKRGSQVASRQKQG